MPTNTTRFIVQLRAYSLHMGLYVNRFSLQKVSLEVKTANKNSNRYEYYSVELDLDSYLK